MAGVTCLGKYYLQYEDSAPIFVCDKCGEKELTWKKFYSEYLQLYKIKENWNSEKDKVSCVLGFFCHMYKETYKTDYVFVPKSFNPFSSKECRDTWTLLASFGGNANDVRKYLFWLFKKCINKNTGITSFGYVNTPNLIRKYNLYNISKDIFQRETKLPIEFIDWCKSIIPDIFKSYALDTMNDLGALISYCKAYGSENSIETQAIEKAKQLGLIKNNKLNIG